jgi:hypothetical protein
MSTWRGERAKERKRSRIVVNVEDERPPGRRRHGGDPDGTVQVRRRTSRRRRGALAIGALIIIAALVATLAGFYFWYQSDKKTPTYSLALLVDAAQRNDRPAIDQLVDIDQVTRSLVPQVVAKISGRATQQPNATGAQTNSQARVPDSVRRYVEANAGVIIPGARDAVRDALIQSIKQGMASRAGSYPFFVTALGARFAADQINVQGDVGRVAFKSNGQPVVVTMQRAGAGDTWRIVAVESDELAQRIADNLSRGLPALGR